MTKSENRTHHEQEAARFRSAAEAATTPAIKALLKQKAEEHERLIEASMA